MATYQNLVDGALSMIGRLESGGTATTNENADFLLVINEILDSWSAQLGPIYFETVESLSWTAAASKTIGSGATLSTVRPVKILAASITLNSIDYPLTLVSNHDYQNFSNKTLTSAIPEVLVYNPTFATGYGTLYMWPTPSTTVTLLLTSLKPFTAVTLAGTISQPPGMQEALRYALAQRFENYYGVQPSQFIAMMAAKTFRTLVVGGITQNAMMMDPLAPGQAYGGDEVRRFTIT